MVWIFIIFLGGSFGIFCDIKNILYYLKNWNDKIKNLFPELLGITNLESIVLPFKTFFCLHPWSYPYFIYSQMSFQEFSHNGVFQCSALDPVFYQKMLYDLFLWIRIKNTKTLDQLWGDVLLWTTNSPQVSGFHLFVLRRIKAWAELGANQNPAPGTPGLEIQRTSQIIQTPFLLSLMTFLMMLSVILPYMLMMLQFALSVIRHLICGDN